MTRYFSAFVSTRKASGIDTTEKALIPRTLDVQGMCPKCMVRNANNKNYRQLVLPIVHQSPLLLKAVLALAASGVRVHDGRFQTAALRYQTEALQGLQRSVNGRKWTSMSRMEIMGTILVLCFFDIYDSTPRPSDNGQAAVRSWRAHSRGLRSLLNQGLLPSAEFSPVEKGILSFMGQCLGARSVLTYSTMSRNEDYDDIFQDATYWLSLVDRSPTEINPLAGCSNELLHLILEIAHELRKQQRVSFFPKRPASQAQKTWLVDMADRLNSIKQDPVAPTDIDGTMASRRTTSLEAAKRTAEAFRLATMMLLENARQNYDWDSDERSLCRMSSYIDELFIILDSGDCLVPPRRKLGSSNFLWPLFICGCHLRCPQQQASMHDHMRRLLSQDELDSTTRNVAAEQIEHVMMNVWLGTSKDADFLTAVDQETGEFVWESSMRLNKYMFEWM